MGNDKIPLISEKQYVYEGYFDIKSLYKFVKTYLEDSKHYDVSEKELEEKNDGATKELLSTILAEQEYTDYFKIVLKFKMILGGKEKLIEDSEGHSKKLVKGKAHISINAYLEKDFMNKKHDGPLTSFFRKVYDKYIGEDELKTAIGSAAGDVGDLLAQFKLQCNSTVK